jgi:DNA repair exonuclease SbcCD ATPase subunit
MTQHDVKLISLTYANILSVGANPITIRFDDADTIFLTGSNGTGKSTLLSSLSYNFYGKTDRDLNKSEIINNINNKELYTVSTLLINGKIYKIERGMKPDILKVFIDGEPLNENASKLDLDKIIVDILGCDYNTFYKLIVISKTNYIPILNMRASERRTFIENILDIEVFSQMQVLAKETVKELKKKISLQENTLQSKKTYIQRDIDRLEQSKSANRISLEKNTEKLKFLKDIETPRLTNKKILDVQALENEIGELQSSDNSLEKQKIQSDIIAYELKVVHLKTELHNNQFCPTKYDLLNNTLTTEKRVLSNLTDEHNRIMVNIGVIANSGKDTKSKLDALENKLQSDNKDICPTCKQDIDNTIKNELLKKINKEIDELNDHRNELLKHYNSTKLELTECKAKLDAQTYLVEDITNQINSYNQKKSTNANTQREIDNILKSIEVLKEKDLDSIKNTKIHVLNERLNTIKDKDYLYEINFEINNLNQSINDLNSRGYDDLEKSISTDQQELIALESDYNASMNDLKYEQYIINALDDKGIKANIIDMYIGFLNDRINYYLDRLGLFMLFSMDRNFKEILRKDHRFDCSYNNLSEGEKQRVDLAIMFAFRDVAKNKNYASFNVLFLDDMTGHIDDEGVDRVLEMIEQEQTNTITVMINHDCEKYQHIFDKVIKFGKKNNFTEIIN